MHAWPRGCCACLARGSTILDTLLAERKPFYLSLSRSPSSPSLHISVEIRWTVWLAALVDSTPPRGHAAGFAPAHRSVWAPPSDGWLQYGWNTSPMTGSAWLIIIMSVCAIIGVGEGRKFLEIQWKCPDQFRQSPARVYSTAHCTSTPPGSTYCCWCCSSRLHTILLSADAECVLGTSSSIIDHSRIECYTDGIESIIAR